VRSGSISKRRLEQSLRRILRLKWKLGLAAHKLTPASRISKIVGTPGHLLFANSLSNGSITLLRDDAPQSLPLPGGGRKVLVTGFGQTTTATLGADIAARGDATEVLDTGSSPTQAQITRAVADAGQSDLVVVSTFNAWSSPTQIQLVNALIQTGKPVVVAAVGTPYDIAYLPNAHTFITSLDYQPVSLHALVRAMFGEIPTLGKLPVTIREPAPSTKVLYPFGYGLRLQKSASGQRRSSP
jgi:beta-N-acetylhexosaminidase